MTRMLPSEFSACRAPDCPSAALCWRKRDNPAEQWQVYRIFEPDGDRCGDFIPLPEQAGEVVEHWPFTIARHRRLQANYGGGPDRRRRP